MKRVFGLTLSVAAAALLAGTAVAFADDAADAKAALKKLADSPNYSWTSATENVGGRGGGRGGRGGGGPPAGKVELNGYTTFTLTMQQQSIDIILQGSKAVAKMPDDWKTKQELQNIVNGVGGTFGGVPTSGTGPEAQILNQINTFKSPVAQAMELAATMTDVKKTPDGYVGELAADAARALATPAPGRGRGSPASIASAHGTLALTLTNGTASRIVIHLEGALVVDGEESAINRNTTIEITGLGASKPEVPAEAKAKLDSIR